MWKIIEVAYERGYTTCDFGRSETTAEGLLNYKNHWGAARLDLPYYSYGRLSGVNTVSLPKRCQTTVPSGVIGCVLAV
jgi:hypothetical protein